MPNWSLNGYIVYSPDKNQIKAFHKFIEDIINGPVLMNNQFGEWNSALNKNEPSSQWLGNFLKAVGYSEEWISNRNNIRCRGILKYTDPKIEYNEDTNIYYFSFSTDTAWIPMNKMWKLILDKLKLDKIHFSIECVEENDEFVYWHDPERQFLNPEDISKIYPSDDYSNVLELSEAEIYEA